MMMYSWSCFSFLVAPPRLGFDNELRTRPDTAYIAFRRRFDERHQREEPRARERSPGWLDVMNRKWDNSPRVNAALQELYRRGTVSSNHILTVNTAYCSGN